MAEAVGRFMEKIRILLADDHDLVREGTRQLLERESDLEVVGEAGDGEEAVRLTQLLQPHVVIMDVAMPKLNGIEATQRIKSQLPQTAVLVLTAYDDEPYAVALLRAGAAGYLLKNVRGKEGVEAIRSVHRGEAVLSPSIIRKVLGHLMAQAEPPVSEHAEPDLALLTQREMDVLGLAARGKSNADIGQELFISARTVQTHMSNIFSKLGVASRTEAVIYALKRGWVDLGDIT